MNWNAMHCSTLGQNKSIIAGKTYHADWNNAKYVRSGVRMAIRMFDNVIMHSRSVLSSTLRYIYSTIAGNTDQYGLNKVKYIRSGVR